MKKNFIYNFLLTGSNLLFPLLTFPYLTRIFGANGLGICNFIISYGQNFIIISALGLPVYGIREIAKLGNDTENRSKLFTELLTIHLSFTLILLTIYITSIFLFSDLSIYKNIALLGGTLIFFNVFSIEWLFSGVNDFKYITIRSLIIKVFSIGSIFVFVKSKNDLLIYFFILFITALTTSIVDLYTAKKFISIKKGVSFNSIKNHIKPISVLGIYMVMTSIYSVLPATLLGFLSTKASVGYYYSANKIIRMLISFFTALVTIMIPKLNMIFEKKEKAEYLLLVEKILNIVISIGIPMTFLVYLLAKPIIMVLAGKGFINSISVIRIMAPIVLFVALAQVFVLLVLSVNRKDKQMMALSCVGMVISLLINLIFIPYLAEIATAFSQLAAEFLVTVLSYFLAKRLLDFNFPIKSFAFNIILVLPFALISFTISNFINSNIIEIICSSILCGIYFLFYQIVILKNKVFIELIQPYLFKFNRN